MPRPKLCQSEPPNTKSHEKRTRKALMLVFEQLVRLQRERRISPAAGGRLTEPRCCFEGEIVPAPLPLLPTELTDPARPRVDSPGPAMPPSNLASCKASTHRSDSQSLTQIRRCSNRVSALDLNIGPQTENRLEKLIRIWRALHE